MRRSQYDDSVAFIVLGYRAKRTSRMMIGIGIPSNHRRIGIACSFQSIISPGPRNETPFVPRPVAELTAFDSCKTCSKRAEQKISGYPKCELRCAVARAVGGGLCLDHDIGYALLSVGLAHAGLRRDQACDVRPVGGSEVGVFPKAGGPQPRHFSPGHIVRRRSGRRGRVRAEKPIDVHL